MNTPRVPGADDAAHCPPDVPGRLPRLDEVVRDAERLGAEMLPTLGRAVDPETETLLAAMLLAGARLAVENALTNLAKASRLLPGEEPTPGSAVALGGATRESLGGTPAPGAGASTDPSPGSGAPAALPVRGVGREVAWPGYVRRTGAGA